jgi:hypothetical protein
LEYSRRDLVNRKKWDILKGIEWAVHYVRILSNIMGYLREDVAGRRGKERKKNIVVGCFLKNLGLKN